jgi:NADPH:quinone reductase-like Zn-dependent oxidoreductase
MKQTSLGVVADVGRDVEGVAVGDEVAAMAGRNGDGGWAVTGGDGGSYAEHWARSR